MFFGYLPEPNIGIFLPAFTRRILKLTFRCVAPYMIDMMRRFTIVPIVILDKIGLSEYGSDLHFPRARASEYSAERGRAYLLSSERDQELPRRYGRHARIEASDSNRLDHCSEKLQFFVYKALRPDYARV